MTSEKKMQTFFDILFEQVNIKSFNIYKNTEKLNGIIKEWITEWDQAFNDDTYDVCMKEYIKKTCEEDEWVYFTEKEFDLLWLNYSPKILKKKDDWIYTRDLDCLVGGGKWWRLLYSAMIKSIDEYYEYNPKVTKIKITYVKDKWGRIRSEYSWWDDYVTNLIENVEDLSQYVPYNI